MFIRGAIQHLTLRWIPSIMYHKWIIYKEISQIALNLVILVLLFQEVFSQLVVNLKNNGGEIFSETIYSNTSQDFVLIEYHTSDGSLINQFVDFKTVSFML